MALPIYTFTNSEIIVAHHMWPKESFILVAAREREPEDLVGTQEFANAWLGLTVGDSTILYKVSEGINVSEMGESIVIQSDVNAQDDTDGDAVTAITFVATEKSHTVHAIVDVPDAQDMGIVVPVAATDTITPEECASIRLGCALPIDIQMVGEDAREGHPDTDDQGIVDAIEGSDVCFAISIVAMESTERWCITCHTLILAVNARQEPRFTSFYAAVVVHTVENLVATIPCELSPPIATWPDITDVWNGNMSLVCQLNADTPPQELVVVEERAAEEHGHCSITSGDIVNA